MKKLFTNFINTIKTHKTAAMFSGSFVVVIAVVSCLMFIIPSSSDNSNKDTAQTGSHNESSSNYTGAASDIQNNSEEDSVSQDTQSTDNTTDKNNTSSKSNDKNNTNSKINHITSSKPSNKDEANSTTSSKNETSSKPNNTTSSQKTENTTSKPATDNSSDGKVTVVRTENGTRNGLKYTRTYYSDGTATTVVECAHCHQMPCPDGGGKKCSKYVSQNDATVTCQQCGKPKGNGYNGTCYRTTDWENGGKVTCHHYD